MQGGAECGPFQVPTKEGREQPQPLSHLDLRAVFRLHFQVGSREYGEDRPVVLFDLLPHLKVPEVTILERSKNDCLMQPGRGEKYECASRFENPVGVVTQPRHHAWPGVDNAGTGLGEPVQFAQRRDLLTFWCFGCVRWIEVDDHDLLFRVVGNGRFHDHRHKPVPLLYLVGATESAGQDVV